ncbi:MAG: FAD:protein FMN transferase [Desulfobacterales bacterium]|nr:FAD:protein FMN transferase [Desulfobacterales bacterium]
MSYEHSIALLDEETVLAECGPMRLVIRAWKDDRPQPELVRQAAEVSFGYLEAVAKHQALLGISVEQIESVPENDLAKRMIQSVKAVGDTDLTPMAAVAGTIADAVADWIFNRGSTKVVVDNGGDISIRLKANETAAVGIRPRITHLDISHVVNLDDRQPSWGVTTSGRGGRSFTRGIASAVTVIADNASIADAAATSIANACFVEDDSIVQIPAEQMDLNTDLKGVNVTVDVGLLSPGKKIQAVQTALSKADTLCRQKLIVGALVALEDIFVMTESVEEFISPSN